MLSSELSNKVVDKFISEGLIPKEHREEASSKLDSQLRIYTRRFITNYTDSVRSVVSSVRSNLMSKRSA